MSEEASYQENALEYASQLRAFFHPAEATALEAGFTIPTEPLPLDVLAERAEGLVSASGRLGSATARYLESEEQAQREGAEMKLLAQATAEVEVAQALLQMAAEDTSAAFIMEGEERTGPVIELQRSLDQLAFVLEQPLEAGMQPFFMTTGFQGPLESDPNLARVALQKEVTTSLTEIGARAVTVVGKAGDALLRMDVEVLRQGVSLISKDVAELLGQVLDEMRSVVRRMVQAAVKLLLQAYDWVLALLGQDVEAAARRRAREWLDRVKAKNGEGVNNDMIASLISRIYAPHVIEAEVAGWLEQFPVDLDTLNRTTETVRLLRDKYDKKAEQVEKFLKVVALAGILPLPIAKVPQFQVALAAITLGLMAYGLYTGYDHVDSGSVNFFDRFQVQIPDRVEGIRETVMRALGVEF